MRDNIKNIKETDPQTLNLYEYCGDNPVSNTDPTGEAPPDYATWKAFEDQLGSYLGVLKNSNPGLYNRIVDFVTTNGDEIAGWEAKSGQYVSNSNQLRAFIQQFGGQFNLVVNQTTKVSQPLIKQITQSGGNIWRLINGGLQDFAASPAGQDTEQGVQDIEQILSNIPLP